MENGSRVMKNASWAFGLGYLFVLFAILGLQAGGFFTWTGLIIIFVMIPLIEFAFPNWQLHNQHPSDFVSEFWLFASPVLLSCLLIFAGSLFASSHTVFERWGIVLSTGVLTGSLGITIAHELVHRKDAWQRALGVWNLLLVNFGHWGVEHVFGHHKSVGTAEDHASAVKSQTLYNFWIKNYFGGLLNSFRFEAKRIEGKPYSIFRNRIKNYFVVSIIASLLLYQWNPEYLVFWWSQSFVAIILLLSVDYIEHYGLRRIQKENGLYEPVKVQHSWDSKAFLTNIILFKLGFHSHHHMKARLTYQELQEQPQALYMPYGYSVMILIALIPPAFFRIMDPLIPSEATRN